LRKTPAFATAAILVLTLGIGSTTAIFSMVNAVLLRSLPFEHPDALVVLWGNVQRQKVERRGASYPDYQDWKSQSRSFQGMAAYEPGSFLLSKTDASEQVSGEYAAPGYFELLGIKPVMGRTIHPDEDIAGKAALVILIGEGFRKRHFSSAPDVLGKQLTLNQQQFTIIGVLPAWFRGLTDHADVWTPFSWSAPAADLAERGSREFAVLARLKSGVALEQAQSAAGNQTSHRPAGGVGGEPSTTGEPGNREPQPGLSFETAVAEEMRIDGALDDGQARPGNEKVFNVFPDLSGVGGFLFS